MAVVMPTAHTISIIGCSVDHFVPLSKNIVIPKKKIVNQRFKMTLIWLLVVHVNIQFMLPLLAILFLIEIHDIFD